MVDQATNPVRKPSAEFWAIVGAAVGIVGTVVAFGVMILTVMGWLRDDIRNLEGEVKTLETSLSGEIKALDVKLTDIHGRLVRLETLSGIESPDLAAVVEPAP